MSGVLGATQSQATPSTYAPFGVSVAEASSREPQDRREDITSPCDQIELAIDMASVLKMLNRREERAIRLRYGIGGEPELTVKEIAQDFGVCRDRAYQILAKAMRKLRQPKRTVRLKPWIGGHL